MNHWAMQYIGTPWRLGAKGPDEFDCWNFVRFIELRHFGKEVDEIDYGGSQRTAAEFLREHAEHSNWYKVSVPAEGDLVMMARARYPLHVGVFISANNTSGVLHCVQPQGVVFTPMSSMRSAGWGNLQFYRRK